MINQRAITVVLTGTAVMAALGGSIAVGLPPLFVGTLVLAAFGGGLAVSHAVKLFTEPPLLIQGDVPDMTIDEIADFGLGQAKRLHALWGSVPNDRLKERVQHLAARLTELFDEFRKKPESMGSVDDVRIFAIDILPKGVKAIEQYMDLAGKPGSDPKMLGETIETVDFIADTVKDMYQEYLNNEQTKLSLANQMLRTRLEIQNPNLLLRRRKENP